MFICSTHVFVFMSCLMVCRYCTCTGAMLQYCTDYETTDKRNFPTFARTRPPDTQISKSVASVLLAFNWTQVTYPSLHLTNYVVTSLLYFLTWLSLHVLCRLIKYVFSLRLERAAFDRGIDSKCRSDS